MGICTSIKDKKLDVFSNNIDKNYFSISDIIGRGSYCVVRRAKHKIKYSDYAIKEISKVQMHQKGSLKSILFERDLLVKIKHPFIVNLQYAFHDQDKFYLVFDLMKGGDLRYHMSRSLYKNVKESQARFFIGCIVLALEYLHSNKIIHRDLKPENFLFDSEGYLYLADLGISKLYSLDSQSLVVTGTPGYISPEIVEKSPHDYATDYYSLGVILFELVYAKRPFQGKNIEDIKNQLQTLDINISKAPNGWSNESIDLINKLCKRNVSERLGRNGIDEIKNHLFFKEIHWGLLYNKSLGAPFLPQVKRHSFRERKILIKFTAIKKIMINLEIMANLLIKLT